MNYIIKMKKNSEYHYKSLPAKTRQDYFTTVVSDDEYIPEVLRRAAINFRFQIGATENLEVKYLTVNTTILEIEKVVDPRLPLIKEPQPGDYIQLDLFENI